MVKDIPNSDKSKWIELGAGWVHKTGKGYRLKLDAYPANGEAIECLMIDWKAIDEGKREQTPEDAPEAY